MKRLLFLLLLAGVPVMSQVPVALVHLLLNAGNEAEVTRLLDQSPADVDQALFAACRKSAQGRLDHRQHPEALREFRATLAVAQRLKSPVALASAYRGLGLSYWRLDQGKEALANYERGLEQATLANDRAMMAELLRGIGVTHRGMGGTSVKISGSWCSRGQMAYECNPSSTPRNAKDCVKTPEQLMLPCSGAFWIGVSGGVG